MTFRIFACGLRGGGCRGGTVFAGPITALVHQLYLCSYRNNFDNLDEKRLALHGGSYIITTSKQETKRQAK